MSMDKLPRNILFDYLDGKLNEGQLADLQRQLDASPELRSQLEEFRALHQQLQNASNLESPGENFTRKVILGLDNYRTWDGLSPRNGMLLFSGIVIAVGVCLLFLKAGVFDSINGTVPLPNVTLNKQWLNIQLPSVAVNVKIIVNGLLIAITCIAFVLLDRTILRPIFNRRAQNIA